MQCNFGANMNFALRDKFIAGMRKGRVLKRMFEMNSDSTLAGCIDAALLREMTLKEKSVALAECNKLNKFRPKHAGSSMPGTSSSNGKKFSFFACGQTGHDFKMCKYKQYKCCTCNAMGYIAAACKKRQHADKEESR